jgi:ketosteroid isomerase-like protein
MSQENVEIVRRVWDAAERRDTRAIFALYDPSIVWESHALGPMERGGHYHGHEGVRRFFRDWLEAFENYQAKAETFVEAGKKVIVRYRVTGRGKASGVEVEMLRWNVYALANNLVTGIEVFATEAEAFESVGLSE